MTPKSLKIRPWEALGAPTPHGSTTSGRSSRFLGSPGVVPGPLPDTIFMKYVVFFKANSSHFLDLLKTLLGAAPTHPSNAFRSTYV